MAHPDETTRLAARETGKGARIAGAVYGTLLVTSVVAGLSVDEAIGPLQGLIAAVVTSVVFWIAHVYSDLVALRLELGMPISRAVATEVLGREWPMVQAVWPAALMLFLGSIGVLERDTAYWLAIAAGVVAMTLWGVTYARREGARWRGVLLSAAVNVGLGLVIVALKVLVSH
jgi:hypothetical protein